MHTRIGFTQYSLLMLLTVLGCTVASAVRPTDNAVLLAVPAPGPVVLDGILNDWDTSGEILVCDDLDKPLHAVRIAAMYDAAGLYLSFRFFDLTPMINHVDPVGSPGEGWCGDAVQLRFWNEPEKPLGPPEGGRITHLDCYWYTDGKRPTAHVVYGSFQTGQVVEQTINEAIGAGVEAAFLPQADKRGYTQEMRIGWSLLRRDGRAYHAGESVRLGIESFWGDAVSRQMPAYRVVDLNNPDHPQRDYYWMNHPAWGTLTFVDHGKLPPTATAREIPRVEQLLDKVTATEEPAPTPPAPTPEKVAAKLPYQGDDPAGLLVNRWFQAGTAAGNIGDWYDNRDRTHSMLDMRAFPQLQLQGYTDQERLNGADFASAWTVLPHITLGNSSTSGPPETDGCNPRSLYLSPAGMKALYAQYRGNNLYIYPGHRDYAPGHNGRPAHGDLLPVNSPYLLISRGSSGSDQPFLCAIYQTLAAFHPEVKQLLVRQGLVMPTVQALLRGAYAGTRTPADYLKGNAHPVVFNGELLDAVHMVQSAQAMRVDTIPPLIQLRVVRESAPTPGLSTATRSEQISDTPCVISRVHRRLDRDLHLVVSAQESIDVNKHPLTFRWVVLHGDPTRIRIVTRAQGALADITIAYHDRFPVVPGSDIDSNRVDIGVFATNGKQYSAPGFISVAYPDNELRTYDARGRFIDAYDATGDTSIGFATKALLPPGDVPIYDITDWHAAFACAVDTGKDLAGQLLHARCSAADRAQLQQCDTEFQRVLEAFPAAKSRIAQDTRLSYLEQTIALDKLVQATCQPLWRCDTGNQLSAKETLERALNVLKDDPQLYLSHHEEIHALVESSTDAVKTAVARAITHLKARGILVDGADGQPAWHSIQNGKKPVERRLTRYEQYEIQSFNLLLMTRVLYPRFLHVEPRANLYDRRLTTSQGCWTIGQYTADGKLLGVARRLDAGQP